jgi:signal transduction histidine kinase
MSKNVRRVSSMVNSFRELSELPEPSFRVVRLGPALASAAEQAGLSRLLDAGQSRALSSRRVYCDPEYLAISLANILKNSSEAGASRVDARWSSGVLTLADDGPGLPADIAEIVARDGPRPGLSAKVGGSGMGLYIVFELCKMMGIEASASNVVRGLEIRLVFRHE